MSKWIFAAILAGAISIAVGCQKKEAAPAEAAAAPAAEAAATAVESSLLSEVKYDAGTQTLTVKLNDGKTFDFSGVSQAVYDGLMAAESKGAYFNAEIKDKFQSVQK